MIFVFKTSVKTKIQAKQLKSHIDHLLPNAKWNFDFDDIDNILRVDCEEDIVSGLINLLNFYSFHCEELE